MVNMENEMVYWLMSRKQSRKIASDRENIDRLPDRVTVINGVEGFKTYYK